MGSPRGPDRGASASSGGHHGIMKELSGASSEGDQGSVRGGPLGWISRAGLLLWSQVFAAVQRAGTPFLEVPTAWGRLCGARAGRS